MLIYCQLNPHEQNSVKIDSNAKIALHENAFEKNASKMSAIIFSIRAFILGILRAKFFIGNENIYSHLKSFLHVNMTQVVEILPQVRQELTYST